MGVRVQKKMKRKTMRPSQNLQITQKIKEINIKQIALQELMGKIEVLGELIIKNK
tara:strand:- start:4826 stop:4990 length:165 start_codon:yes stop_codon:yes gene_type:complete